MGFGDIVEPSTRAFIDDLEDDNSVERIEWTREIVIPNKVEKLFIIETEFVERLLKIYFFKQNTQPIYKTRKQEIVIYELDDQKYALFCKISSYASCAGITEQILKWIDKASTIYAISSSPITRYQNKAMQDKPLSIVRTLNTGLSTEKSVCEYLEQPNIVTGVGANVLSYCKHVDKRCELFIGYVEHGPVDSDNSEPFLKIFPYMGLRPTKISLLQLFPENNLYI